MLSPEESHHLARVLRVQAGQEITLFDGRGNYADALVADVRKSGVSAQIIARYQAAKPRVQIDLLQAIPKPDRWELVLQKAVELGVGHIYPLVTEHTEFKSGKSGSDKKIDRWHKIILNAAQQCEVRWLPELHAVSSLGERFPDFSQYDAVLIGSLYPGAQLFRAIELQSFKRVALLIGPEGDFSADEVRSSVEAGAIPISFGDRILRTETAAIFGLSVLAYSLL